MVYLCKYVYAASVASALFLTKFDQQISIMPQQILLQLFAKYRDSSVISQYSLFHQGLVYY